MRRPIPTTEKCSLHNLLRLSDRPNRWPAPVVAGALLGGIALVAGLWGLLAGPSAARYVAFGLLVFTLDDLSVLLLLPFLRISFGPVKAQLLILALPRLAVAALGAGLIATTGLEVALAIVGAIEMLASAALAWGALIEPGQVQRSHLSVPSDKLPLEAPPLRLLQISDLHVERFGKREEQVLDLVEQTKPDLIVLTGDYVNLSYIDDPTAQADLRRLLEGLSAPLGVYAVLGSPPVDRTVPPLFRDLPIRLLRDEVVVLERAGWSLALLGLDCSHRPEEDGRRLATLAARAPAGAFRLLLYHSPDLMPIAPQLGIDLYLCGHTHGGQVRLPLVGALVTATQQGKRFEMGPYRHDGTHLYVSRGVGLEGMGMPRVRLLSRPEVTLVAIEPAT